MSITIIYLAKHHLARISLIVILIGITLTVFHTSLKSVSEGMLTTVVAGAKLHPIYAVDTKEKVVAFSFDAAWGNSRTPKILQILADHEIKTTFFLTNIWLKQYPDLAKQIVSEGHETALHSDTHPNMTGLTDQKILAELTENAKLVTEITGQKPLLFRPPFGAYNNKVLTITRDAGFIPIQWSVDSLDWKNLSADSIYQRVTTKVHPGAIVLFHNDGANTPQALEPIIEYLKKEGYRIVPISEIIYKDFYYIDNNGIQKLKKETM